MVQEFFWFISVSVGGLHTDKQFSAIYVGIEKIIQKDMLIWKPISRLSRRSRKAQKKEANLHNTKLRSLASLVTVVNKDKSHAQD